MSELKQPCGECGMLCRPQEYHPYAACLMFKGCHNADTVRVNMDAICHDVSPKSRPTPSSEVVSDAELEVRKILLGRIEMLESQLANYEQGAVEVAKNEFIAAFNDAISGALVAGGIWFNTPKGEALYAAWDKLQQLQKGTGE